MKKTKVESLKPYISILITIGFLFSIVFLKMEARRLGYVMFKVKKQLKLQEDEYLFKKIELAKKIRPDRIRYLALTRLTMDEAKKGQIIQFSGEKIVLPQ